MDDSHTPPALRLNVFACCLLLGALLAGCDRGPSLPSGTSSGGSTATPPAASATPSTATATSAPSEVPTPEDRLERLVLSIFAANSPQDGQALADLDVLTLPLPAGDRDLWLAVTSGSGIWELEDTQARHILAVYERRPGDAWVEMSVLQLASEPTMATIELVPGFPEGGPEQWIAVHGSTGAHSSTFELVRFDGMALTSAFWWFSPSPQAATLEDIDGDGLAEVVMDATDPYVYCYACGVRAWAEILYRWEDGRPVEVPIAPVQAEDPRVLTLTEQAVRYAEADLWRRAQSTMRLAVEAAPEDQDVYWLQVAIDRTATLRLDHAGAVGQPLVTAVLAGEYDLATALMAEHAPAEVFDLQGPLFAGTAAEGWGDLTTDYLVDYSTAALAVEPTLAGAYAVRALGRTLAETPDWGAALLDMDAALAIEPANEWYRAARAYLLERNGGAPG